jgi:hypothetical protein
MSPYNRDLHPAEAALLRFFDASHLRDELRQVSQPFGELAVHIVNSAPAGAETTTALRKLLEAKDCAVRAALD